VSLLLLDVDAPGIIPPVTRAFTRTAQSNSVTSKQDVSQTATHQANIPRTTLRDDLPSSRDVAPVAFRPVTRIPANSEVSLQQLQSQASKPKRYSTQRQRGQLDTGDLADLVTEPTSEQVVPQASVGYALPPRLQRNKYYGTTLFSRVIIFTIKIVRLLHRMNGNLF